MHGGNYAYTNIYLYINKIKILQEFAEKNAFWERVSGCCLEAFGCDIGNSDKNNKIQFYIN